MKQDATSLALLVGISTLINVISATQRGKDAVVPLVGGGMSFVSLAVFGGITGRYDVSNAFAWVFLIGTLVLRGGPLIQGSTQLVTNAKTVKPTLGPAGADSTSGSGKKGRAGGGGGGGGGGGV